VNWDPRCGRPRSRTQVKSNRPSKTRPSQRPSSVCARAHNSLRCLIARSNRSSWLRRGGPSATGLNSGRLQSTACFATQIVVSITPYNESMATTIRPATRADVPQILAFIRALAAYEREPDAVTATEADLLRDGFGPNPFYFCLIAEVDGAPAGFALCFFSYSTWLGRPGLYLEDLFVHPQFRGLGIGKTLLHRVAAIAVEKGCPRLQWEVLDWNTSAIDFYLKMGAEFMDTWRNVRVTGDALLKLAGAERALAANVLTQAKLDGSQ
jgi:GNAT superfamily N-acetyltransferase